jgi:hypothetical protein
LKDLKEMSWQELDELRKDLESKLGEDLGDNNNGDSGDGDQLNPPQHWIEDELVEALRGVSNLAEAKRPGPKKDAPKSPPKGYPTSRDQYADPENYKYPLDTYDHARAALGYFSHADNRSGYSPEEQKYIWRRIIAAAKRHGIELSDDVKKHAEKLGDADLEVNEELDEKKLSELVDKKLAEVLPAKVKEQMEAYAPQVRVPPDIAEIKTTLEGFKAKHAEFEKKLGAMEALSATYPLSAMAEKVKAMEAALAKLAPPQGDGNGTKDQEKKEEKSKDEGKPPEKVKEQTFAPPAGAPVAQGAVATPEQAGSMQGVGPVGFETKEEPPRTFAEAMDRAYRRRK